LAVELMLVVPVIGLQQIVVLAQRFAGRSAEPPSNKKSPLTSGHSGLRFVAANAAYAVVRGSFGSTTFAG